MPGLHTCLWFTKTASRRNHSGLLVEFATSGSSISPHGGGLGGSHRENEKQVESFDQGDEPSSLCGDGQLLKGLALHPSGNSPERQKQLWKNLFSYPLGWWDNRLDKRSSKHQDFRHKLSREPLWLTDPYKPAWFNFRLGNLDKQLKGSSVLESAGPGAEIQSLCEEGQLEKAMDVLWSMDQQGISLSVNIYTCLLKTCAKRKALAQAKRLHAHLAKHGLESIGFLGEYMVSTLVKCNGLEDARQAFQRLSHRTVFSWTAMICGYTMLGQNQEALKMYQRMLDDGVEPDTFTFVSLLKACGNLANLSEGRRIHGEVLKYRCDADSFVLRCLVDMYGKCGSIADACVVFDRLPQRNVVSWNVMLTTYAQEKQPGRALQLHEQMLDEGVSPNDRTFVSVLQACGMLAENEDGTMVNGQFIKVKSLQKGRAIHDYAYRKSYVADVFVGSTLVSMYGKCGSIVDARNVFDGLSLRNVVSWNVMLAAYVQLGQAEWALELYENMREEGASPNNRTFIGLFQACAMLGEKQEVNRQLAQAKALAKGRAVHADAWSKGFASDVFVGSTIVRMYGKCGSITDSRSVFDSVFQRDVVLWNAMLGLHAEQGQGDEALQLFEQMQEEGVDPNGRTFVSMLQACGMLAAKEDVTIMDGQPIKMSSLGKGKAVHAHAGRIGCVSDAFVGSTLVGMYGKCGSIQDARNMFDGLKQKNVVAWTTMLMAYVEQAQPETAMQLYEQMCEEGVSLDAWIFVSALQSCGMLAEKEDLAVNRQSSKAKILERGKAIHEDARRTGYDTDIFVGNTLISMYSKCGSIVDAWNVFDVMAKRDIVSWNSMLRACAEQGSAEMALQLYEQMQEEGESPDGRTYVSLIQAHGMLGDREGGYVLDGQCTKVFSLEKGKVVHAEARRQGYDLDVFVCSTLISMYAKCGSIADAQVLLHGLPRQDVVLWNVMLAAYIEQGEGENALKLYEQMREEGLTPDVRSLVSAVQACGILAGKGDMCGLSTNVKFLGKGKAIHAEANGSGHDLDVFVGNTLVSMYGKCGSVLDALTVFDGLAIRSLVSWNAMLSAYAEQGQAEEALHLYGQMLEEGVSPDVWTFVTVLRACCVLAEKEEVVDVRYAKLKSLEKGKAIHINAKMKGYDSDVFVGNTLVSMYGKCGSIVDAQNVFDGLSKLDVVSWNAMLTAHAEQGQAQTVLQLYYEMQEEGASPDVRTFVTVFQACGMLADMEEAVAEGHRTKLQSLEMGKAIQADAQSRGLVSDVFVGSALVAMYGKCGSILDAESVFVGLSHPDVVAWNAMLTAYVEQGEAHCALHLYAKMQEEGVSPDARTFVSLFQACGSLAGDEEDAEDGRATKVTSLEIGRAIHADARQRGYDADVYVGSTLISMYGKCGSIDEARAVFEELHLRDVVTWNSMLVAYVEQGQGDKALQLYRLMLRRGVSPNEITLVCMLQACSDTGSLAFVREIHEVLVTTSGHNFNPHVSSILISAYGRCASMVEAQCVFDELLEPSVASWNALIAGHARQGSCAASLRCYDEMQLRGTKPDAVTFISLLSACSHAGLVEKGVQCFDSMSKDHGITPRIEHYVTMVDLLGRAGCFTRIEELLSTMEVQPSIAIWLCLLGACQKHGKVALGEQAFDCAVRLQPKHAAAYVLMANIYADAERPACASKVMKLRQKEGARKDPGQSWIQHEHEVHTFVVADHNHGQLKNLYDLVEQVGSYLKEVGHVEDAVHALGT